MSAAIGLHRAYEHIYSRPSLHPCRIQLHLRKTDSTESPHRTGGRKGDRVKTNPKQSAQPKSRLGAALPWLVIGCVALAILAAMVAVNCLVDHDIERHRKQSEYDAVEGKVVHCELIDAKPDFNVSIEYAYRVGDHEFHGTRVNCWKLWGHIQAKAFVDAYPAGAPIKIFYDRDDPAEAVLEQDPHGADFWFPGLVLFNLTMITILVCPALLAWKFGDLHIGRSYMLLENGEKKRVRVGPPSSPSSSVVATGGMSLLYSGSLLCFSTSPSVLTLWIVWGITLAFTVAAGLWIVRAIPADDSDLVIDPGQRTLTIPRKLIWGGPLVVGFGDIRAIAVLTVTDCKTKQNSHRVVIRWESKDSRLDTRTYQLVASGAIPARELARYLRKHCQFGGAT
jgi:hypothetical protein